MGSFYPQAPAASAADTDPVSAAVARAITAYNDGLSYAAAIGGVLNGSDRVRGFGRVWSALPKVQAALLALDPTPYANITAYKAGLASVTVPGVGNAVRNLILAEIDQAAWWAGLQLKYDVSTFAAFKAAWEA